MVEYIDRTNHGTYHLLTCLPSETVQIKKLFGKVLKDEIYYNYDSGLIYRPNTAKKTKNDFPYLTITGDRITLWNLRYPIEKVYKEIKVKKIQWEKYAL